MSAADIGGEAAPERAVEKAPAEKLALRTQPRPVARFRRPLIVAIAAVGATGLVGFAWLALGPRTEGPVQREVPSVPSVRGGDEALALLPKDYSQAKAPALGPPLPGDLGRAVLDQQRRGGVAETASNDSPSASARAEQAEHDRIAAQVRQAREASVMVQTSGRDPSSGANSPGGTPLTDVVNVTGAPPATTALSSQDAKRAFLAGPNTTAPQSTHQLTLPASPYQVLAGAVISAALITGLDSDLPGFVTAQVSENVYDTVSGRYLLIPQGSRLLGAYDSKVVFGQRRALVVWQRLTLPDGASIQLDNLPATDPAGYAGLRGTVDNHTWAMLQGVAVATLLGVGTELALDDDGDLVRAVRQSTQQASSQAGQQIVGKQLEVQPTLRVPPGAPLRILVHTDLTLRPWSKL